MKAFEYPFWANLSSNCSCSEPELLRANAKLASLDS